MRWRAFIYTILVGTKQIYDGSIFQFYIAIFIVDAEKKYSLMARRKQYYFTR